MKDLEKIIGKKAYWGMHTFEATKDTINGKKVVRIEVYRNVPRTYERTFFIHSKEQFVADSGNETQSLKFFTGNLNYRMRKEIEVERKLKSGRIVTEKKCVNSNLAIDSFIEAFRHDL
jgi:hypothetical protein